jgi:hypothetical protein
MSPPRLDCHFSSPALFLSAFDSEVAKGGLLVRGATLDGATALGDCLLAVRVGEVCVDVPARIAAVIPGVGVAVVFAGAVPEDLRSLAERIRETGEEPEETVVEAPTPGEQDEEEEEEEEDEEVTEVATAGPVAERIKGLTVSQKMQLALSADRETRFALLRDTNKVLHLYVLKNPRVGIDEVQHAARMTTLSTDALRFIGEQNEWNLNAGVCAAIVRNPRTPLPLALKLLDRVSMSELRIIAKGNGRAQLVHAARKKVTG